MSSTRRTAAGRLLAVLALLGAGGCHRSAEPPRHVVLVTLDTVRADRIGCYGRSEAGTPWLDALAARGARVERAYAAVPITLPSHVSILTGLLPPRTGVRDNGQTSLASGTRTLAEVLAEQGFHAAAAVGGFPVARRFPTARGFARYDDRFLDRRNPAGLERDAGDVVRAAVAAASARDGKRLFLWAHFFDAHDPYEPPSPWRERFALDPYQGEIARIDAALSELDAGLRSVVGEESILWVVVADHGEALGDHGEDTHGFFLYESTVRVPFVLAGPGIEPGRVVEGPVGLVDVMPTILDRLAIPIPPGLDGVPIDLDATSGGRVYLETLLPAQHYGWSPLFGAVEGRSKLIDAPRPEIYDLREDPGETVNLWPERRDDLEPTAAWLRAARGAAPAASDAAPDPRLASLGYVGTAARAPADGATDPKDRISVYRDFQRAARMLEAGRGAEALPAIDRMLAAEDAPGLRLQRARALRMTGRFPEASKELDRVAGDDATSPAVAMERTRIAAATGDGRTALREVERYLAAAPGDAEALMFRGAAREMVGDPAGAVADYVKALESNPAFAGASLRLARRLALDGRIDDARRVLARHLELHPGDELARGLLAAL